VRLGLLYDKRSFNMLWSCIMTMVLNELLTPKKIKIAILVLATFAAMC